MDYAKVLKKIKKQELAPRSALWNRIEDTLDGQTVKAGWKPKLVFSAAAVTICALLAFGGIDYYGHYRLEQYLLSVFDYPVMEYFDLGTFI
jgi:hypothetical protein